MNPADTYDHATCKQYLLDVDPLATLPSLFDKMNEVWINWLKHAVAVEAGLPFRMFNAEAIRGVWTHDDCIHYTVTSKDGDPVYTAVVEIEMPVVYIGPTDPPVIYTSKESIESIQTPAGGSHCRI